MSKVGTRTIVWRGGEDEFCLAKSGDILALEDKCNAGVMAIMRRLENDGWYLNDVRETIRIGLIGAGMAPEKAMIKVKLHVDGNPQGLAPSVLVAHAILAVALIGVPDDPVGKNPAADAETQAQEVDQTSSTTTAASAAPPSSESAPASSGRQASPTNAHSGSSSPASMASTEPTAPTIPLPTP